MIWALGLVAHWARKSSGAKELRILDPSKHTVAVIKENVNPNWKQSLGLDDILGFKNLVSSSSLPVSLKEKMAKGVLAKDG